MKHTAMLIFCILAALLFAGCSTSTKNEASLQEDLADYLNKQSPSSTQVTSFQIEKRQTDEQEKSDIVYVLATTETDITACEAEYIMTYGLYNEGWILDAVETQTSQATPLHASTFTESEITEILQSNGYSGITDLVIYDHTSDLASWMDTYSLTAKDCHTYMTEQLDLTIVFTFDPALGWTPFNSFCAVNSSVETWDIAGSYARKKVNSGEEDGKTCTIQYFEGGTILWYFDDQQDYERRYDMTDVSDMSPTEFFANHGRMDDTDRDYHIQYGYTVAIDNVDWSTISYAAPQIYLGKDHIYIMDSHERTDFDQCIHYELDYELIPLD